MTEHQHGGDEAAEAAQHVADSVESWEYSAEEDTVRGQLDEGLDEAGVDVPEEEKDKLVDQIKDDETSPHVEQAEPGTEA